MESIIMYKTIYFYFHGLGSCSNSTKVKQIRDAGFTCFSPHIPIDPALAEPHLIKYISDTITEEKPNRIIMIGTSLGGFWAARMGELFDTIQVLINPAMNPHESLLKYVDTGYTDYSSGNIVQMPKKLVDSYLNYPVGLSLCEKHFFIAKNDPVVTPFNIPAWYNWNVKYYDSTDHQGASFFSDVLVYLKRFSNIEYDGDSNNIFEICEDSH
jgi:predicted esterase YcpF (UPF0227 family)